MKLSGENRSTRGKTCPSATLSTTNPTWTDPGSNPGLRGERPATNRLNRGTAYIVLAVILQIIERKVHSTGLIPRKFLLYLGLQSAFHVSEFVTEMSVQFLTIVLRVWDVPGTSEDPNRFYGLRFFVVYLSSAMLIYDSNLKEATAASFHQYRTYFSVRCWINCGHEKCH
jgi:hypothetical protein